MTPVGIRAGERPEAGPDPDAWADRPERRADPGGVAAVCREFPGFDL